MRVRHLFDGRGGVAAYRAANNVAQQHDEKVLVALGDEETRRKHRVVKGKRRRQRAFQEALPQTAHARVMRSRDVVCNARARRRLVPTRILAAVVLAVHQPAHRVAQGRRLRVLGVVKPVPAGRVHPNHLRRRRACRPRLQPPALDTVQIHCRLGQLLPIDVLVNPGQGVAMRQLQQVWRAAGAAGGRGQLAPFQGSFAKALLEMAVGLRGRGHVLQSAAALGQPLGVLCVARLCATPTVVDRCPPPVAELVEPRHHAAKAVRQGSFLSLHGHQPRKRRIKRRLERMHGQVAGSGR